MNIKLEILPYSLSVCKVNNISDININKDFFFLGKTDEETSLVCPENDVPDNVIECENGWRALRIIGILDFSLIGIISKISTILADNAIGIFVISTYNTDYILIKEKHIEKTTEILIQKGYTVA